MLVPYVVVEPKKHGGHVARRSLHLTYALDDHEQHRARQLAREQCIEGVALLRLEVVQRKGGEEYMW